MKIGGWTLAIGMLLQSAAKRPTSNFKVCQRLAE
jgi:hypothetical protein